MDNSVKNRLSQLGVTGTGHKRVRNAQLYNRIFKKEFSRNGQRVQFLLSIQEDIAFKEVKAEFQLASFLFLIVKDHELNCADYLYDIFGDRIDVELVDRFIQIFEGLSRGDVVNIAQHHDEEVVGYQKLLNIISNGMRDLVAKDEVCHLENIVLGEPIYNARGERIGHLTEMSSVIRAAVSEVKINQYGLQVNKQEDGGIEITMKVNR